MASRNPSATDGASGNEVAVALVSVVQRMIEEAARPQVQEAERRIQEAVRLQVQEAVRLQVQEAERRLQEALRLQEERAATALRQMEQRLRERDSAISALRHSLDERVQRLEARVAAVEEQLRSSSAVRESEEAAEQGALEQLESRMGKLEGAVQRALASVFPRVEALVERLETSPPGAPLTPSILSTFASPSSAATTAAAASASYSTFGTARGEAWDDEEDRQLLHLELRMREVRARRDRALEDPSCSGEELCRAAFDGNVKHVRRALLSRVDVNYTSSHGGTALISAFRLEGFVGRGNLEVVRLLLESGADVTAIDVDGWTALHCAAPYDPSGRATALLLDAGADVNARDKDGATPLHRAAYEDNEAVVRILLEHGANRNLRCWSGIWEGDTPYDLSREDVIKDLLRVGFRVGGVFR